jgi:hypothetical protein
MFTLQSFPRLRMFCFRFHPLQFEAMDQKLAAQLTKLFEARRRRAMLLGFAEAPVALINTAIAASVSTAVQCAAVCSTLAACCRVCSGMNSSAVRSCPGGPADTHIA